MDLTSLMGSILSNEGINGISQAANVSSKDVSSILEQALPQLLQGANNQANSAATSASFVEALTNHAKKDTTNMAQFFNGVDLNDGAKIVQHLMGANAGASVAQAAGVKKEDANNVMSAAAPLLMSLLGQQTTGTAAKKDTTTNLVTSMLSNVDMSKIAKTALKAAAAGVAVKTVKKAVSGNKKTSKKNGVDLSDGLDVSDVVNLVGKIVK